MAGDREESKIPITTVVGLAMALATLWLVREPLHSSRPEIEPTIGREAELIEARLWQDPIETAVSHQQADRTAQQHHNHSLSAISFSDGETARAHIGVLIIITEGSPYAENHEKRLRDRYAALSALGVACFVPSDEEHVGYFEFEEGLLPFEWYKARKTRQCHQDHDYKQHYDRVLVVWATDDILGERPLNRLNEISGLLASQYWADVCGGWHSVECMAKIEFKIIGPPSSSMLRGMLQNARDPAAPRWWPNMGSLTGRTSFKIALYSPWATASPELLLQGVDSNGQANMCEGAQQCRRSLAAQLANAGVLLEHTIESDEELSLALVGELGRRQVKIGEDPIALIGEWDTFYGRALPIVFRAAACFVVSENITDDLNKVESMEEGRERNRRESVLHKRFRGCESLSRAIRLQIRHPERWDALDMNIHRYSYLRGLDGLTPGASQKPREAGNENNGSRSNSSDKKTRDRAIEDLERPDGQSQLDYLRRLVAQMKQDTDGVSGVIRKPPKAIGVLGSDVYDTLLILKAVREEFPNAIFFTTDLDARLLQERESKWTRNLVIAAPFGLRLDRHIQHDIPPFRDSYQTSGFFAMLRALGHIRFPGNLSPAKIRCEETQTELEVPSDHYEIDLAENAFSSRACPRLFEIGRHGPVNLSGDAGTVRSRLKPLKAIQPSPVIVPRGMKPWWDLSSPKERLGYLITITWLGFSAALVVVLFTRLIGRSWNVLWVDLARRDRGRCTVFMVRMLALAALISYTVWKVLTELKALALQDGWEGEPVSFFDGVSTWPTICLRTFVILWCMGCLIKAGCDLLSSREELVADYAFPRPSTQFPFSQRLWGFVESIQWLHHVPYKNNHPTVAEEIWRGYLRAGCLGYRLGRSLILTVGYIVFLRIMLAALSHEGVPFSPCRGPNNCHIDQVVVIVAAMSMIFLNMFAFDAVMLCRTFIERLSAAPVKWPKATLNKCQSKRRMNTKYLSHYTMVRLVADRTRTVHKWAYCPFIALFLMVLSRNRFFDNWDFPIWLIVVWIVYSVVAVASLFMLRSTANKAREKALTCFREQLISVTGRGERGRSDAEQIRLTIDEIEDIRQGAYAPFFRHPAFTTSLLAILSFLQYWLPQ